MENTVVDSESSAFGIDDRLKQLDALLSCLNVVLISPEASLYTNEVTTLMSLSRELIEDCRTFSGNV